MSEPETERDWDQLTVDETLDRIDKAIAEFEASKPGDPVYEAVRARAAGWTAPGGEPLREN